ncbi:hypothetical protein GCM10027075_62940 [Streptomyces heilongjiangensis]
MRGGGARRPYRIRLLTEGSLDRPGPLAPHFSRVCEGSALAVDLAAYDLVFTRGTPPRTEGCRTAGRGLVAVTHDLARNVREVIAAPQLVSG